MKKFFAVIGNPPYQEIADSDSTRMPPIYNDFMDASYRVAEKTELITPARFLFDAGYTPKQWNQKMLNDPHLKVLKYTQDSSEVFPGTDIKGGVAVTYRDTAAKYDPISIFTSHPELNTINAKVLKRHEESLEAIVYPALSYKASALMTRENYDLLPRMRSNANPDPKALRLRTSAFDKLPELFYDERPKEGDFVQLLGLRGGERAYKWIDRRYLLVPDNFEKYKVILPKSNGSGAIGEVLSTPLIGQPLIGQPLIGHTQTFISIGSFDTEDQANNCLKYVKSKFARALLGILKITQDNPPSKWKYVPLQDFTNESDIDWSQSISEIDQQLYVKYGLTPEEIDFIETRVREME